MKNGVKIVYRCGVNDCDYKIKESKNDEHCDFYDDIEEFGEDFVYSVYVDIEETKANPLGICKNKLAIKDALGKVK